MVPLKWRIFSTSDCSMFTKEHFLAKQSPSLIDPDVCCSRSTSFQIPKWWSFLNQRLFKQNLNQNGGKPRHVKHSQIESISILVPIKSRSWSKFEYYIKWYSIHWDWAWILDPLGMVQWYRIYNEETPFRWRNSWTFLVRHSLISWVSQTKMETNGNSHTDDLPVFLPTNISKKSTTSQWDNSSGGKHIWTWWTIKPNLSLFNVCSLPFTISFVSNSWGGDNLKYLKLDDTCSTKFGGTDLSIHQIHSKYLSSITQPIKSGNLKV